MAAKCKPGMKKAKGGKSKPSSGSEYAEGKFGGGKVETYKRGSASAKKRT